MSPASSSTTPREEPTVHSRWSRDEYNPQEWRLICGRCAALCRHLRSTTFAVRARLLEGLRAGPGAGDGAEGRSPLQPVALAQVQLHGELRGAGDAAHGERNAAAAQARPHEMGIQRAGRQDIPARRHFCLVLLPRRLSSPAHPGQTTERSTLAAAFSAGPHEAGEGIEQPDPASRRERPVYADRTAQGPGKTHLAAHAD